MNSECYPQPTNNQYDWCGIDLDGSRTLRVALTITTEKGHDMDPILRQIVDRCHVSISNRELIKYMISCLTHKRQTWLTLEREVRKEIMNQAIDQHELNKGVYQMVMRGGSNS